MRKFTNVLPLTFFLFSGLLFFTTSFLKAQDFTGFNVNPWSGVSGIDLQPANIVGTVYKADVNILGASIYAGNNYLKFKPKPVFRWSLDQDKSNEIDTIGVATKFVVHSRIQLPSAMFEINPNMAVALTIQARFAAQTENIGKEVAKMVYDDLQYDPYLGKTYTTPGISINQMSWAEIGLTYGYLHYLSGGHRFKIAARIKYLMGLNALYINSDDASYQFDAGDLLSVYNSNFNYGHTEADSRFLKFKPQSHSVGLDAGVKYSFKNRLIFGVSLLDVGALTFDKAPDTGDFTANINNWDLNNVQLESVQNFDDTLQNRVTFKSDKRQFKMALPTAISFQATAYLWDSGVFEGGGYNNIYLSFYSYNAINLNKEANRLKAINTYVFTPGFTTLAITGGLPVSINEFEGVRVGGFLRLGPFVLGSKNIFSSLLTKEISEADAYLAIKVPILKAKPSIVQGCPKHF